MSAFGHWGKGDGGLGANEGVGVGKRGEKGVLHIGAVDPRGQKAGGAGFPKRRGFRVFGVFRRRVLEHLDQWFSRGCQSLPGFGDPLGSPALVAVHAVSIPVFHGAECPFCFSILMASVAGVGDAKALGHKGVGDGKAVISPRMPLHVSGVRHVAVDAEVAFAVFGVVRMGERLDLRAVGMRAVVTAHAKRVAGEDGFGGVRMVAVHAVNARLMHSAAEEGGKDVVFVAHLAVRVEDVGFIWNGKVVVVKVEFSGMEVSGKFGAARMATAAGVEDLRGSALLDGRVWSLRGWVLLLPLDVVFHRAVAGFAADGAFGHRSLIGVGKGIVVFAKPRIVARSAHAVPVHASSRPMSPFAGASVFLAIDAKPALFGRIKSGVHCLKTPALMRNEELAERFMADNSANFVVGGFPFESERGNLSASIRKRWMRFRAAVGKRALVTKSGIVQSGAWQTLGQTVVGDFPRIKSGRMAFPATFRAGILRENGFLRFQD